MVRKDMYACERQMGPLMSVHGTLVVILLRFYALQGDKILCSFRAKIVRIVRDSPPIKHAFTRDKILVREGCYKK